ncbi:MAG: hypothetical protein IGS23_02360 [Rivularia sp. T60_A2020_040]|nr:hypothetical protein [Rivularia sp. T60_A2020_040]
MNEDFLFVLLKVIWQDLIQDVAYDSTKQNWQVLQAVIDENKHNKQVNQSLIIALNKCFYSSSKIIAEKCREELIKKSTFIQYRGAKIYSYEIFAKSKIPDSCRWGQTLNALSSKSKLQSLY